MMTCVMLALPLKNQAFHHRPDKGPAGAAGLASASGRLAVTGMAGLLMLLAVTSVQAAPAATDFRFSAQVLPDTGHAGRLQRLRLSLPAMQAFETTDQRDLRLFDADGNSLPVRLVTPTAPARSQSQPLRVKPGPAAREWLFRVDPAVQPQQLAVQWATAPLDIMARVEGSTDQQTWHLLGSGRLQQSPTRNQLQDAILLQGQGVSWLRLRLDQPLQILGATYTALERPQPLTVDQPTEFISSESGLVLDLQADLPVASIGFSSLPPAARHWRIQGRSRQGLQRVAQPLNEGRQVINFDPAQPAQVWRITGTGTSELTRLPAVMSWAQRDLWFVAPDASPLTLAIGSLQPDLPAAPVLTRSLAAQAPEAMLGKISRSEVASSFWRRWWPWLAAAVAGLLLLRVWLGSLSLTERADRNRP